MKNFVIILSIYSLVTAGSYDMLPDPNDCSSYKISYDGNLVTSSCSTGLHFSPTELICLPPELAKCEQSHWCTGQPAPSHVPDPIDCKVYYQCSNGSPVKKTCSSGLWWDVRDNSCRDQNSVKCDFRTSVNPKNPGQYQHEFKSQSQTALGGKIRHVTPKLELCTRKKDLFSNGQYLKSICLIQGSFTYEDARKRCAAGNMNLFIIDNEEVELQFYDGITSLIPENPNGYVWINGKRQKFGQKNWEVSNSDGNIIGSLYSGIDFYSQYTSGNCLQYSGQHSGQYQALPALCTVPTWATCEHHLKTANPDKLDTSVCLYKKDLQYKDKYIKSMCVINQPMNYDNSRRKCASLSMNLFIFDDSETEQAFYEANEDIFTKHAGGHFWINGMRDCNLNNWHVFHSNRSVSGQLYDGMEWVKKANICGQTSGNCLKLSGQHGPYQAFGANCADSTWMICEYYI